MIVTVIGGALDRRVLARKSAELDRSVDWSSLPKPRATRTGTHSLPSIFGIGAVRPREQSDWHGWPSEHATVAAKRQARFHQPTTLRFGGNKIQPRIARTYAVCRDYLGLFVLQLSFAAAKRAPTFTALTQFIRDLLAEEISFSFANERYSCRVGRIGDGVSRLHYVATTHKKKRLAQLPSDRVFATPGLLIVRDTERVCAPNAGGQTVTSLGLSLHKMDAPNWYTGGPILLLGTPQDSHPTAPHFKDAPPRVRFSFLQSYLAAHLIEGYCLGVMVDALSRKRMIRAATDDHIVIQIEKSLSSIRRVRRLVAKDARAEIKRAVMSELGIDLEAPLRDVRQKVRELPTGVDVLARIQDEFDKLSR